ncbi:UNVERIFIED_CONTAM: hypothetical protein GTU68_006576 [Idotea baltica]|nr:hypothetical protein [Idotea baltica]
MCWLWMPFPSKLKLAKRSAFWGVVVPEKRRC